MITSIELNQTWHTTREASDYFLSIARMLERISGDFPDAPKEWYFHIEGSQAGEYKIELSHL